MKDEGKACPATDRKVMVIGAGVAGRATASALLDLGVEVVLVERSHSSGTVNPNQKEGKLLALNDSIVVGVERSDAFRIEVESTQGGCRQRSVHDVDAVILATGLVPVDAGLIPELGLGRLGNVISSSQLEERLASSEAIRRPSDGGPISTVVFVLCVGSRVEKRGVAYCSAICCANAIRCAIMLKQGDPEVGVYVLYIDVRTVGKGEEAMYKQARQLDVKFIRGQPALVAKQPRSERLLVCGENTLLRELYEIEADLVVLAVGLREDPSNLELFHSLGVELDQEGLIKIGDSSDGAVSTSAKGVFVAGSASAPMGIDEARAMGTRAAHAASAFLRSLG
jgi:heterodisulfide reductase subunit A